MYFYFLHYWLGLGIHFRYVLLLTSHKHLLNSQTKVGVLQDLINNISYLTCAYARKWAVGIKVISTKRKLNCYVILYRVKFLIKLTFLGLSGTLSLSLLIPGMMTVIRLGPFIPKTFVSWGEKQPDSKYLHFFSSVFRSEHIPVKEQSINSKATHIDDAS